MNDGQARKIICRQCGQETVFSKENPFRPFCSKRCRLLDLGDWASENFRIPTQDSGSLQDLAELEEAYSDEASTDLDRNSRRDSIEPFKKN